MSSSESSKSSGDSMETEGGEESGDQGEDRKWGRRWNLKQKTTIQNKIYMCIIQLSISSHSEEMTMTTKEYLDSHIVQVAGKSTCLFLKGDGTVPLLFYLLRERDQRHEGELLYRRGYEMDVWRGWNERVTIRVRILLSQLPTDPRRPFHLSADT